MRRLWSVFLVASVLGAWACGQEAEAEKARASKEKKVRELLEVTGASKMGEQVMDNMLGMMGGQPGVTPDFLKRFRALAKPEGLTELVVPIYMKHLDEATVDAAIVFFRSAGGREFIKAQPLIMQESMAAGAEWGRKLAMQAMAEMGDPGEEGK